MKRLPIIILMLLCCTKVIAQDTWLFHIYPGMLMFHKDVKEAKLYLVDKRRPDKGKSYSVVNVSNNYNTRTITITSSDDSSDPKKCHGRQIVHSMNYFKESAYYSPITNCLVKYKVKKKDNDDLEYTSLTDGTRYIRVDDRYDGIDRLICMDGAGKLRCTYQYINYPKNRYLTTVKVIMPSGKVQAKMDISFDEHSVPLKIETERYDISGKVPGQKPVKMVETFTYEYDHNGAYTSCVYRRDGKIQFTHYREFVYK